MNPLPLAEIVDSYGKLFTQTWFNTMWLAVWQGALIFAAVGMLCIVYPKFTPTTRIWLWRISFTKCLMLLLSLPQQPLPVLPKARALLAQAIDNDLVATLPTWFHVKYTLSRPLFLFWLALFLFYILQLAQALRNMRQCQLRASVAPEPTRTLMADLSRQMNLRQIPRIQVSHDILTPMATGIFRPVILVPAGMVSSCTQNEMQMIIAHELAHIKRRDLLWNWLPTLARMFVGFNPLVRVALQELNTAQEAACDQLALTVTGGSPSTYGHLLLSMTSQNVKYNLRYKLAPSMASTAGRALKQRIKQLRPAPKKIFATYAIIGLFILAVLPFRLTLMQQQPESAKNSMIMVEHKGMIAYLSVSEKYKISINEDEDDAKFTTVVR